MEKERAFLNVRTCFDINLSQNRTVEYLQKYYTDRYRLTAIMESVINEDFLQLLRGKKIFIKPNWVRHSLKLNDDICLRTHDNFVLCFLEIVLRNGAKSVTIGDSPIQGCDWDKMHSSSFLCEIKQLSERFNIDVLIKDFRKVVFNTDINKIEKERRNNADYLFFDLKERSYLDDISDGRFRITCYPSDRLNKSHTKGKHIYCIVKEIFESDIVISLPKLKTHQKTGITGALKNIVGINGDKDYLPHHRVGGTKIGGDCYPGNNVLRSVAEFFSDLSNQFQGDYRFNLLRKLSNLSWKLSCPKQVHQLAAGWYGNDTCWRMVADLNHIIRYGTQEGKLSDIPQRCVYSLADGIIGGQGNGPLDPLPLPLGVVCFSNSSPLLDVALCHLMNFDPQKINLIKYALSEVDKQCFDLNINHCKSLISDLKKYAVNTLPPPGWSEFLIN